MSKPWSEWTPSEHLDAAGALFDKHNRDHVNGLHKDLIQAQAHVSAAATLARIGQVPPR